MCCVNTYSAVLNSLQRNFTLSATFNVLSLASSNNLLTHTHTHTHTHSGTLVAFSYARVGRSVVPINKELLINLFVTFSVSVLLDVESFLYKYSVTI